MADVNISKYRASVVRSGSTPATPGFVVSEGQNPVEPAGSEQNHLPVTINATATGLAITTDQVLSGAGTVGQYIRGDGSLADFPASTGGGSSVSYYLNGSISQGTIGGVAYKELSKTPILGAGTQFTINADGYIASFLTDAGDPNLLEIPGGNWNFETYFSASSGGGSPTFYVELYKYDGSTFTLIASNSGSPELIAFGTNVNSYFSTLAVPTTALTLTDRLAIRYYVTHSGRTITLHTENNTLCQIITTFTTGLTALNGLTAQVQYFAVGTSGTDFNIASATQTHTFNLPTASASNRGALSSADWSTFNAKQNALTLTTTGSSGASTLVGATLNVPTYTLSGLGGVPTSRQLTINGTAFDLSADRSWSVGTVTSVGLSSATSGVTIGNTPVTGSGTITLAIATATSTQQGLLSSTDWSTFNNKQNAITLTTTGTSGAATLVGSTLNIPQYQSVLTNPITGTGTTNYLPKFTGSTTVGNSQIFDNGNGIGINTTSPYTATNFTFITTNNTSGSGYVTRVNGTLSALIYSSASGTIISEQRALPLIFETSGNTRATLDSSGNLGLGVTPSAWNLGTAMQFTAGSLWSLSTSDFNVMSNTFYSSGYKYVNSTGALRYFQDASTSSHSWHTAPSGTAGNAISFTQAMTLNASGNLLVGTTSDNGARLQVSGAGTFTGTGLLASVRINNTTASTGKDWHLYSLNNGNFGLYNNTDGSYAYQVTPSGNIGVGTTSPSQKLEVNGRIRVTTNGSNGGDMAVDAGGLAFSAIGATPITFQRSDFSAESMRITSTGNVGIGTSSPAERLHVETSSEYQITWARTGAGKRWAIGTDTAGFYFNNRTDSILPVYITNGGNVLIGTTTDNGARLQVSGTARISGSGSTNLVVERTGSNGAFMQLLDGSGNSVFLGANNGDFQLQTPSGGFSNKLVISNSGAATFSNQVTSGSWFNAPNGFGLTARNAANTAFRTLIFLNSGNQIEIGRDTDISQIRLGTASSVDAMTITSGGNVLIGTTTDNGARLQVNGFSRFDRGTLQFTLNPSYAGGNVYSQLQSTGALALATGGDNNRLYIDSSGAATFSSSVTAQGSGSATSGTINLISSDSFIRFNTTGGTADKQKWDIRAISATGFEALEFRTVNDANNSFSTKMWLAHNGNVGIGTSSPGSLLTLSKAGSHYVQFVNSSTSNNTWIGNNSGDAWIEAGGAYGILFQTNGSERMRITSGGNVLIGTTTDVTGANLNVNGNIRTAAPTGGNAANWRLGTARAGTITPNAIVRIEIAGVLVDLDARYV